MIEIVGTELKSDLLTIYKNAGHLLDFLEVKDLECHDKDIKELLDVIKFRLHDITGTLQKDIFNIDCIISKTKMLDSIDHAAEGSYYGNR